MNKLFYSITFLVLALLLGNCTNQGTPEDRTPAASENEALLEDVSTFDMDSTLTIFTRLCQENSWSVVAVHDLQATLKKKEIDVLPVQVFALCKGAHSKKILSEDAPRIVSSLMPCRVSIYEKSDGLTYISRMDFGAFAKNYPGTIEEVMNEASQEIEQMINQLIK